MTPEDERAARLARLPVWAQREIATLTSALADAEDKLAHAHGVQESTIWVGSPYGETDVRSYIREGDGVTFSMGETKRPERAFIHVMPLADGSGIEVRGGDSLYVFPCASNVFLVKPGRF